MNKLTILSDCVLWDGDQIAFIEEPGILNLCMSSEDFSNNEIPTKKRAEITDNKIAIMNEFRRLGYSFSKEDENREA